MSYEIDNLKRELSTLKYEVARKVDDESFRRKLADLESNINRKITDLVNDNADLVNDNANLRDRLDRLIETIESNNV